MFTGIIESLGRVEKVEVHGTNKTFYIASPLSASFKIDQSVSHNGVCLTVESVENGVHRVTAIEETLVKSNLGEWQRGDVVNIEQCMQLNGRLDGHIVQGHVDETATCEKISTLEGSSVFAFRYDSASSNITVEKGSICVNGVSLTVVESGKNYFSVAVIPYTFEHTNFHSLQPGHIVNIEFDVIGKYVSRLMKEKLK